MGKISDALEKSKRDFAAVTPATDKVLPDLNEKPPVNDKPLSSGDLGKQRQFSAGTNGHSANDRSIVEQVPTIYPKHPVDPNLISLLEPQSFEAEQFKMLRTSLLFPLHGTPPRSIMVTSVAPGEGKSFVASNLAVSIAQNINEHVLLMDCDMRSPSIHSYFGFDTVPGLSEHLTQGTPLNSLLLKSQIKKLTILPAGATPHNPSELLSSEQMGNLLGEVTARYNDRLIIIDSPPPHLTSEASAISRRVDGVLLVLKTNDTPRDLVEDLINMLGKEKILGVVMNWFDMQTSSYLGYGKYAKYDRYYKKR